MSPSVLLTCEHATNRVPARYAPLFRGDRRVLDTHRGWDPGAAQLARQLARRLGAPLLLAKATRLLADPNRSERHERLFSEWTRGLARDERERILERYWRPHRDAVERHARASARRRRTLLHLSIHSFTPVWEGVPRDVDVGFLYDPARPRERAFAGAWLAALGARRPDLRLRRNRPYHGAADGLTTSLRRQLPASRYLGFELEVSQRFPLGPADDWRRLRSDLTRALVTALERPPAERRRKA